MIGFVVVATALLVIPLGDDPGVGLAVAPISIASDALILRVARARVELSADGVRVVNPFRTYWSSWDQVADFTITSGRELAHPLIPVCINKDGVRIFLHGLQGPYSMLRSSADTEQSLVVGLREEMRRRTGR
ncbi:MAG: PH domain-containing protein [Actinomycetota bacterium]|nr:PH domain-containing protein [Actinomycetota bacterium]